jgi:phosphatidylglycerol:prolipoprotein diacylglycerol transferase
VLPYIQIHDLHVGPFTIHPFGLLVATGTLLGVELAKRRGKAVGLPADTLMSFIGWMLVGGFVGGHVLDEIFYHPHEVIGQPWSLLYLWAGLSSFGGFIGAFLGVASWKFYAMRPALNLGRRLSLALPSRRARPLAILPYSDVILAVFPVAWVFGRLGCTVVHDHPGIVANPRMPLTVAYGLGPVHSYGFFDLRFGDTPRYDLGLLEMLFALIVAAAFASTWKKRLPVGWYVAALPLVYAPVRFALDFLRLDDPAGGDMRYAGLTPAQWACMALFGAGLLVAARLVRQPALAR